MKPLQRLRDQLIQMALEQIAKGLLQWAPKKVSLPKNSLEVSIDHWISIKARGDKETESRVDEFFDKIKRMGDKP